MAGPEAAADLADPRMVRMIQQEVAATETELARYLPVLTEHGLWSASEVLLALAPYEEDAEVQQLEEMVFA